MKLCSSISILFEAVPASTLTHCVKQLKNENASSFQEAINFTEKIKQLEVENSRLIDKLNH
jgi:hypothetical protein